MTILKRGTLGTDPKRGWMYYDLHFASTYVFGEGLLVGHYRSCIQRAESVQAGGLGAWALKMKAQDYHEIYTHAFVSMWAAFETAMENMVATYVRNDEKVAETVVGKLGKNRQAKYPLASWPWTTEACLAIASALENAAKTEVGSGGADLLGRLRTMLGWLDVQVEDNPSVARELAEANRVRNIILHRYGEVGDSDAAAIPALSPWVGQVLPMTSERFERYVRAVAATIVSFMGAVSKSRHQLPEGPPEPRG